MENDLSASTKDNYKYCAMKDSFNVIKQISLKVFKGFLGIISEPSKGSFIKKEQLH